MNIIPQPKKISLESQKIRFLFDGKRAHTNFKHNIVKKICDVVSIGVDYGEQKNFYCFYIGNDGASLPPPASLCEKEEAYCLTVTEKELFISAKSKQGIFYGLQTLMRIIENEEVFCGLKIEDYSDVPFRCFHFDLRSASPTCARIIEIIDNAAAYKYNAIILEYENNFPFKDYPQLCTKDALTREEIAQILKHAKENFINIIPLQQTLGHLEYVLKFDEYKDFREIRTEIAHTDELPFALDISGYTHFNYIDEICACNKKAYEMVVDLCRDIAEAHEESEYFHIGSDEAWNLISCEDCKAKYGDNPNQLFIDHLNLMAEAVLSMGKKPMVWDDMFRHFDDSEIKSLNKNLVIMCWVYSDVYRDEANELLIKYKKHGLTAIGASAVKCSEMPGDMLRFGYDMPDFSRRLKNADMWVELEDEHSFGGLSTTIWSNSTGTLAPPHPFFDTVWYPLLYNADGFWNHKANRETYEARFIKSFFGVDNVIGAFCDSDNYEKYDMIAKTAKRRKYEAEVYRITSLLSLYRKKAAYVAKELYKLYNNSTENEKKILQKRVNDAIAMAEYIKPLVRSMVETHFSSEYADEFIDSRFFVNDFIFENLSQKENRI